MTHHSPVRKRRNPSIHLETQTTTIILKILCRSKDYCHMGLQMSQKTATTPKRLCGAEVGIDQMSSSIALTTGLETRSLTEPGAP